MAETLAQEIEEQLERATRSAIEFRTHDTAMALLEVTTHLYHIVKGIATAYPPPTTTPQPPAATSVCPLCGDEVIAYHSPGDDDEWFRVACDSDDCEFVRMIFQTESEAAALALFARITGQGGEK